MNKINSSYKTISEVVKILGLKSKNDQSIPTHTIRYWEKEFKQIKPKIFSGKRRFYDNKSIKIIKHIKYLLKDKGMTIKGAKKILNNSDALGLDEYRPNNVNISPIDGNKISEERIGKFIYLIIKKVNNAEKPKSIIKAY